ncbi:unnamed protein product, partial [Porites lobata]
SHQKLLEAIEERSKYEDINSKTLWLVLKDLPLEELKEKATWHRSCYQETTHSGKIKRNPLHLVSTSSAGSSLDNAVKQSKDPKLLVKPSTALDSTDAHAIDIKYHKSCWAKHLEQAFDSISNENNSPKTLSRRSVKELIQKEIKGVEFHKPSRANEPERVSVKQCRDTAIHIVESTADSDESMKTLFDAASILRKAINRSEKWVFSGSLDTMTHDHCPEELTCFFRWIIQGPNKTLSDKKCNEVHKRAMQLAQNTIALCLTDRQVDNKRSKAVYCTREMPQHLAVSLAIHQAVRSKELVNLLHGFGMAVEYNRLLRVESQIEKTVLKRIESEGGMFLPPDIVKGRHVYFAIDNIDFSEDTPDGKRTLHGTAMAIYQKVEPQDEETVLRLEEPNDSCRSVTELPESLTSLMPCVEPPSRPPSPAYPTFELSSEQELPQNIRDENATWIVSRTLTGHDAPSDDDNDQPPVPVWSAYNSLVNEALPVTRVGAPPLLAHPAHEWSTLLTVLMRAQNISVRVVGPGRKTVISLDLGLYLPAKRLQMARCELKNILLRPGELHVVMAMLRTIGSYIDSSGIDMCWIESELYGPSTVKQIIDGKHVKREFITGNWVVNKNKEVPFCAVGGDTALEHLNRSMKVSGGLVGITLNESARAKFFLIAPELARLTTEAKAMAGLVPERAHHQELNSAVLTHEDNSINKLTETIKTFTNPFSSDQNTNTNLYNLVTKVVMNEKTKKDLVNQSEEERKLFSAFVQDRIKTGKINLRAPVKKRNLLTWKTSAKVIKVKAKDTIIELKEDRNLFARLAMVCKSRPEIDIQEAAGGPSTNTQEITAGFKVAIVDGMAEVQSLDKPEWIKNSRDLAEHFTNRLLVKYNDLQELHIIFDRYDVPSSLKSATRVKRQGGHVPIYYRITDSTHIAKLPMKKLLAHSKTKGELTTFLAKNVKDNANGRQVVVAWGTECEATHRDVRHLRSTQEEADTKIILHALDASAQGATQLSIYSPDTDVLVLALRRYPDLCSNSCFRLPPTQAALHQAILRAHYQLLVWNNDHVANPVLPSPEGYEWQDEDGKWVPVMTNLPPAPEAIIQLVRCKCAKSRCSNNRCQCQKAGLVCTDLCLCSEDCQNEYAESDDEYDEDEVEQEIP